jgi:uncharacterized protein
MAKIWGCPVWATPDFGFGILSEHLTTGLTVDPLETLDEYLRSDQGPDARMGLSDLDGFLTGVACFPEEIPENEWLDVALGDASSVPNKILMIVRQRYFGIRDLLEKQRDVIEPVFWQAPEGHVIAMDWCEGFMEAVKLRPKRWRAFNTTDKGAELMLPILVHMFDDDGNSLMGLSQPEIDETLDEAAKAIPTIVPAIFRQLCVFTQN